MSKKIALKSNETWSVGESSDWTTVSPSSGTGDAEVEITAGPNRGDGRIGTVVFETAVKKLQAAVKVTQNEYTTLRFSGTVSRQKPIFPSGTFTESFGVFQRNASNSGERESDVPMSDGFSGDFTRFTQSPDSSGIISVYNGFIYRGIPYDQVNMSIEYRADEEVEKRGNPDNTILPANTGNARQAFLTYKYVSGNKTFSLVTRANFLEIRVLSIEPAYWVRVIGVLPDLTETLLGECEADFYGNYDLELDISRQEFDNFRSLRLVAFDEVDTEAVDIFSGYDEMRADGCRNDIMLVTESSILFSGTVLRDPFFTNGQTVNFKLLNGRDVYYDESLEVDYLGGQYSFTVDMSREEYSNGEGLTMVVSVDTAGGDLQQPVEVSYNAAVTSGVVTDFDFRDEEPYVYTDEKFIFTPSGTANRTAINQITSEYPVYLYIYIPRFASRTVEISDRNETAEVTFDMGGFYEGAIDPTVGSHVISFTDGENVYEIEVPVYIVLSEGWTYTAGQGTGLIVESVTTSYSVTQGQEVIRAVRNGIMPYPQYAPYSATITAWHVRVGDTIDRGVLFCTVRRVIQ